MWNTSEVGEAAGRASADTDQRQHGGRDPAAGCRMAAGALGGVALGAGLMYLFDPARGRRRRALMRDRVIAAGHHWADGMCKTARYTANKAYGTFAEARSSLRPDHPSDRVLIDRVRSAMGRATSDANSIEVDAHDGVVTVRGPILADEVDAFLNTVCSVRGVREVNDELEVHDSRSDVPALQGGARRGGRRWDVSQEYWSPATRLLAGLIGASLGVCALQRRGAVGAAAGVLGAGLLLRSASNLPSNRLTGVGAGRRAIDVHKTIHVNVPVEHAFDFWSRWENFPRVMRNVREVYDSGHGRSHWVVAGPGVNVEWDAETTAFEPNRRIAWKSLPGSTVQNAGTVRFSPGEDGSGTKIEIRLSYNPPGGALGHALAKAFGADPRSEMNDDLVRLKTFLETGRTPHDAAQRSRVG